MFIRLSSSRATGLSLRLTDSCLRINDVRDPVYGVCHSVVYTRLSSLRAGVPGTDNADQVPFPVGLFDHERSSGVALERKRRSAVRGRPPAGCRLPGKSPCRRCGSPRTSSRRKWRRWYRCSCAIARRACCRSPAHPPLGGSSAWVENLQNAHIYSISIRVTQISVWSVNNINNISDWHVREKPITNKDSHAVNETTRILLLTVINITKFMINGKFINENSESCRIYLRTGIRERVNVNQRIQILLKKIKVYVWDISADISDKNRI